MKEEKNEDALQKSREMYALIKTKVSNPCILLSNDCDTIWNVEQKTINNEKT